MSCSPNRLAILLLATTAAAQTGSYVRVDPAPPDTAVVAFDPVGQRVLAYNSGPAAELWQWDGQRWLRRLGAAMPTTTVRGAFFDTVRSLFVGVDQNQQHEWNGARWLIRGTDPGPVFDGSTPVAFDAQRRRAVVYAGQVHEWDGTSWSIPPQPLRPPGRTGAAFAYDPVLQRCVLYGGGVPARADCWSWNGTSWTLMSTVAAPGPRAGAALAFDAAAGRLVLYGGSAGTQTTWALAGATWTQLPTTNDPGERVNPRFVFDSGGLLLFGGTPSAGSSHWRLVSNNWQQLSIDAPTARYWQALAVDPPSQGVVMFGGSTNGASLVGDTWIFDGAWHRVITPVAPPERSLAGFAWSNTNSGAVLFGGLGPGSTFLGDTWLWNGSTWSSAAPVHVPTPRLDMVLVPDPLGGVMLFSGVTANPFLIQDQWHWNGLDWQQQTPPVLPWERQRAGAAYDPIRNRVVLAGGLGWSQGYNDAWEWDGTNWQAIPAPTTSGFTGRMAFRPDTRRVLLECTEGRWEWDGASWTGAAASGPYQQPELQTFLRDGRVLSYPHSFAGQLGLGLMTSTPAAGTRFGTGCALGLAPGLSTRGRPMPGQAGFAVVVAATTAQAPMFLCLGFTAQNQPLGAGCSQLVGPVLATLFDVAAANGEASFAMPLPNLALLRGVEFVAQAAALDPSHSLYLGITLTEGLRIAIGD